MAFDAGSVFIRLTGLFDGKEFDKWDRAVDSERAKADKPIEAKLGADTGPLDKDLADAEAKLRVFSDLPVDTKIGVDEGFLARSLTVAKALVDSFDRVASKDVRIHVDLDMTAAEAKLGILKAEMDALDLSGGGFRLSQPGLGSGRAPGLATELPRSVMPGPLRPLLRGARGTENVGGADNPLVVTMEAGQLAGLGSRGANAEYLPYTMALTQQAADSAARRLFNAQSQVQRDPVALLPQHSLSTLENRQYNPNWVRGTGEPDPYWQGHSQWDRMMSDPYSVGRRAMGDIGGGGSGGGHGGGGGRGGGGEDGGGGWFSNFMFGPGRSIGGRWGGLNPFAWGLHGPFGMVGGALGLGPEHLLTAAGAVAGSGVGALGGLGMVTAGALGQMAVGGGSDMAVMRTTMTNTRGLVQQYNALNQAIIRYGKNSNQARTAQANLNAAIAGLGGGVGAKAENQLAKNTAALQDFWQKTTQSAQAASASILEQVVNLGHKYVPFIANAAKQNLDIINTGLKPLFSWLEGPTGIGIFEHLENRFKSNLPMAVDAFNKTIEALLRSISQASDFTGGLTRSWDKLATRWNNMPDAKLHEIFGKLYADLQLWQDTIKNLAKDLYHLFKDGAGEGNTLVAMFDNLLKKWGAWETSMQGSQFLHTFFQQRAQETVALMHSLGAVLSMYGSVYKALQPLVPLVTEFATATAGGLKAVANFVAPVMQVIGSILHFFVQLGSYSSVFRDVFIVPLGLFLITWNKFGLSAAKNLLDLRGHMAKLGEVARGVAAVTKTLFAEGPTAAWAALKGLFSGKEANSPQMTMLEAMKQGASATATAIKEGFASGVTALKEAMGIGGKEAAGEMEGGISAGGKVAGAEMEAGTAAGGKIAGTEEAAGSAAGGAGGGLFGMFRRGGGAAAAGEAATAGEEELLGGAGLMAGAKGLLKGIPGRLGGGLMIGLGGAMGAQMLGGLIGGSAGHTIGSTGSSAAEGAGIGYLLGPYGAAAGALIGGGMGYIGNHNRLVSTLGGAATGGGIGVGAGAATGAAIGMLGGPIGAGAGALIGAGVGLLGGALGGFLSGGESKAQRQLEDFQKTLKGIKNPADLSASALHSLMNRADELAKKLPDARSKLKQVEDQLGAIVKPKDQWNKAFNEAWTAVNKFFRDSGHGIKALYDDFNSNMKLIESTVGLHSAAGAHLMKTNVDKMVQAIEHGMDKGKIDTRTGLDAINKVIDQGVHAGALDWQDKWQTMFSVLQGLYQDHKITTNTYLTDLRKLHSEGESHIKDDTTKIYQEMFDNLKSQYDQGKITHQQFLTGIHQAQVQANQQAKTDMSAFSAVMAGSFVDVTKAGANGVTGLIKSVNSALKMLGAAPLTGLQVSIMTNSANQQKLINSMPLNDQQGALGLHHGAAQGGALSNKLRMYEGGGVVPGAEFGYSDRMTLVDPMGRPRAIMAGDEAVFTRHQMPYVEAGLQLLGFGGAHDLWRSVNRPHGYETGGRLPGYATGGAMTYGQIEGAWDRAGGPSNMAALMAAIAMAESSGNAGAIQQGQPYATTGWGLWQITPGNSEPQFGVNQALLDPLNNAKAALAKYRAGGLSQWTTFTSGAFRRFLQGNIPANLNLSGIGGILPTIIAPHVSGSGSLSSLTQHGLNKVANAANAYLARMAPTTSIGMGTHGFPGAAPLTPGLPSAVSAMIQEADAIASHDYNYEWGGGHGTLGVPGHGVGHGSGPGIGFDCSGAVSAVLGAGKLVNSPMVSGDFMHWGDPGPGKYVTIYSAPWHTFMEIDGHYFGTSGQNPGGGANWMRSFPGALQAVTHPPGLAQGGYVGRFTAGDEGARWRPKPWLSGLPASELQKLKMNPNAVLPGFATGGALGDILKMVRRGSGHTSAGRPSGYSRTGGYPHKYTVSPTRGHHSGITHTGTGSGRRTSYKQVSTRGMPSLSKLIQTVPGSTRFADDDAEINKLEDLYTRQENLYNLYDPNGLTLPDLNTLMGIREQEWGILWGEYRDLPGYLKGLREQLYGRRGKAHHIPAHYEWVGKGKHRRRVRVPAKTTYNWSGGIDPEIGHLTGLLNQDEQEVNNLEDLQITTRMRYAAARHNISAAARSAAQGHVANIGPLYDQLLANIEKSIGISEQIAGLPNPANLAGLYGNSYGNAQQGNAALVNTRRKLENDRSILMEKNSLIREKISIASQHASALARQYSNQGFELAYQEEMASAAMRLRVRKLREAIAKLKKLLAAEQKLGRQYDSAVQSIATRLTGANAADTTGQSVLQNLGDMGFDILSLKQQGAKIAAVHEPPAFSISGRHYKAGPLTQPADIMKQIMGVMSKLGVQVPTGAAADASNAAAAFNDFLAFQADRANMFSQFGSNFAPMGSNPFSGQAGAAAGMQYYGAASGDGSGVPPGHARGGFLPGGGGGDTNINIEQHFNGAPDPHTYSAGLRHELGAMV